MSDEELLLKKFIENNNEYFKIDLEDSEIEELTKKLMSRNNTATELVNYVPNVNMEEEVESKKV